MPVARLPGDAQFLAQIAHLRFRLTHRRHRQPQLGGGHLEGPTALPVQENARALAELIRQGAS
jgi:hypothetical protein